MITPWCVGPKKEMEAVWNYKTMVDRKRWGVGNVITSSPYGPHGEHPERWQANGARLQL